MALLKWKDEFMTGVETIDAEHRALIDAINKFDEECRKGEITKAAKEMFAALKKHAQEHSKKEESLMSLLNYPELDAHRIEHQHAAHKILEQEQRFQSEGSISSAEIKGFVIEYFYKHILSADRDFGDFVKTTGKKGL